MKIKEILRRKMRKTEFYILLVLIAICVAIEIASGGQLFQISMAFTVARAMIITGMFALCSLMVIISGGFDLSFNTLASLAYSAATTIALANGWCQNNAWAAFLMAGGIGLVLGMLNGFIISRFRLNTMIVTLGTQTLFLGISMGLLELKEITSTLPQGLESFGNLTLFEVTDALGRPTTLPVAFIFLVVLGIIVWFLLRHTMFGRSLYAIGGNEVSAERAGINVRRTKFWLYAMIGFICGIIGVLRVCMVQQSIPKGLNGWDMKVLPAVILGGASIYGGEGTVFGTMIAVILITTISNSMLLIGIDSYWQDFFNGLVILAGVTVSAVQAMRKVKGGVKA